jgi:hypothetical protein
MEPWFEFASTCSCPAAARVEAEASARGAALAWSRREIAAAAG